MRRVSTRVLPEPAPATMSRGPPRWTTEASWDGVRPSTNSSAEGAGGRADGVKRQLPVVGVVARAPAPRGHSHSMVPGGLDVMSRATRLTPSTSLMIRELSRSRRS